MKPDSFVNGVRRPETILVISDGEPSDRVAVERVIIDATHKYMTRDEDLSITFIQVGNDSGAERWLQHLDDGLQTRGARFDCVDTMSFSKMKSISFNELIDLSVRS